MTNFICWNDGCKHNTERHCDLMENNTDSFIIDHNGECYQK